MLSSSSALLARWDPLYKPPGIEGGVEVPNKGPDSVRVLSLNLAHGRGTAFHQVLTRPEHVRQNLQAVARLIQAADADVVALQELDAASSWSGGFDHLAYLAELTGYQHTFHGLHVQRGFPRLAYGTGILSRFPLSDAVSRPFSQNPLDTKGFVYAHLDVAGVELAVVSVHLDFKRERERQAQLNVLSTLLELQHSSTRRHLVVAGDFNTTLRKRSLPNFMERHGLANVGRDHTFPSRQPERRLDYVLIGPTLSLVHHQVLDVRVSDHMPVLAELRLP